VVATPRRGAGSSPVLHARHAAQQLQQLVHEQHASTAAESIGQLVQHNQQQLEHGQHLFGVGCSSHGKAAASRGGGWAHGAICGFGAKARAPAAASSDTSSSDASTARRRSTIRSEWAGRVTASGTSVCSSLSRPASVARLACLADGILITAVISASTLRASRRRARHAACFADRHCKLVSRAAAPACSVA